MTSNSLGSIFNETKGELASYLSGLTLPKDAQKIQEQIATFLNKVCDENSDYLQNLTQSEDYILQAALSMLNAQRDLVSVFNVKPCTTVVSQSALDSTTDKPLSQPNRASSTNTLIGAGGGALLGKLVLGGWGAVFGAIAGTAVVLYLATKTPAHAQGSLSRPTVTVKEQLVETPLDVNALLAVIAQICDCLDNLVSTFRAQINRVVNKYESQEAPTIEREYRVLLEGIQSLIGYKRGHNPEEEKYVAKLQTRIEDLAELLDNYDLEAVNYTPDHANWFEAIESNKANTVKMVTPAIIKNGALVIKGKIFIPQTI